MADSTSNSDQTSTVGSTLQSVEGTVQRGIGRLLGSNPDVQEGSDRQAAAEKQNERSHAAAKLGPITATAEGGTHVDNKDRQQGSWDQTIGSGKQFIGGLVGNESLKVQGHNQYNQGVQREAQGQASDLVEGYADRVGGALGSMLTSNKEEQEKYKMQHDGGKAAVRSVEQDLQSRAEADQRAT